MFYFASVLRLPGMRGAAQVVSLVLLLVSVLLVCASCTIERIILYNTEQNPSPRATPIAKIEAHG